MVLKLEGKQMPGRKFDLAKLTKIVNMLNAGKTQTEVARAFNVSQASISQYLTRGRERGLLEG